MTSENPSIDYLQELKVLVEAVLSAFRNNVLPDSKKNIIQVHSGGKQVFKVYECLFQNKKIAIKLYKPILTHLIVHTVAITHILRHIGEYNELINDKIMSLSFPNTIALGQPTSMNIVPPISILVQDWIGDSEEIHKILPTEHITIIKSLIRKLTIEEGFMLDIMSKNWLVSKNEHKLFYVDLILFNPKDKILEKIKSWLKDLEV